MDNHSLWSQRCHAVKLELFILSINNTFTSFSSLRSCRKPWLRTIRKTWAACRFLGLHCWLSLSCLVAHTIPDSLVSHYTSYFFLDKPLLLSSLMCLFQPYLKHKFCSMELIDAFKVVGFFWLYSEKSLLLSTYSVELASVSIFSLNFYHYILY